MFGIILFVLHLYAFNNLEKKKAYWKANKKRNPREEPCKGTPSAEKPLMPAWLYRYSNEDRADGIGFSPNYKHGFLCNTVTNQVVLMQNNSIAFKHF